MALFSRKEEKNEEQAKTAVVAKAKAKALPVDYNLSDVIKGLRITEKAVKQGDQNVYTFNVNRAATKFQVRDAVKALYNVTPVKVNIVNKKASGAFVWFEKQNGESTRIEKAYVYLKKGDTINLV